MKKRNTTLSPAGRDGEGLQSFRYYLQGEGLKESTIHGHIKDLERFIKWAAENELSGIEQINYNELLGYIQQLKKKNLSIATQNIQINSLRKYYEHLKQEGIIEINPTKRLQIKGRMRTVIHNPLSYTELETLYHQYCQYIEQKPVREERHRKLNHRSKVIVGLMIWQGLHSGELAKLETEHVNLKNGSLYIPSTARSKSRELKLATEQIIPLHEYINSLPATQNNLFTVIMHNAVINICNELKGINPVVKNAGHIRASVILHWMKMYDKRQVQYMAGHKWISSTEHYEVQELTSLTDLLTKHHPFS